MSTIHDVVKNEDPTDVILFLTRNIAISHPQIDRLYCQSNWVHLGDCIGLIELIKKMTTEELITPRNGGYMKGAKWRAPTFLLEKKYTFERR